MYVEEYGVHENVIKQGKSSSHKKKIYIYIYATHNTNMTSEVKCDTGWDEEQNMHTITCYLFSILFVPLVLQ